MLTEAYEFGPKPLRGLGTAALTAAIAGTSLLWPGPLTYPLVAAGGLLALWQLAVLAPGRPWFRADAEGVHIRPLTSLRYRVRLRWDEIDGIDLRGTLNVYPSGNARFDRDELRARYQVPLLATGVDRAALSAELRRLSAGRFG